MKRWRNYFKNILLFFDNRSLYVIFDKYCFYDKIYLGGMFMKKISLDNLVSCNGGGDCGPSHHCGGGR